METLSTGKHTFEIIDYVPKGYMIWNIGVNMPDGYLPLCKLLPAHEQPFAGGCTINTKTLKAIKCDGAQKILAALGYGPDTISEMERYVKRYEKSENPITARRVQRMKEAIKVMYTLEWR